MSAMTTDDYKNLAMLIERVIQRHKATESPNPLVLMTLEMLRDEFDAAPQIIPMVG